MKLKNILNEKISRKLFYFGCAFAYGWGVGTTTMKFWKGLSAFLLWIVIFLVAVTIESSIRKENKELR